MHAAEECLALGRSVCTLWRMVILPACPSSKLTIQIVYCAFHVLFLKQDVMRLSSPAVKDYDCHEQQHFDLGKKNERLQPYQIDPAATHLSPGTRPMTRIQVGCTR